MSTIALLGVDRPGLAAALAPYGLAVAASAGAAVAALASDGAAAPGVPAAIEAATVDAAIAALRRGIDEVVLASDPDPLVAARLATMVRRQAARSLVVGDLAIDLVERCATRAGRRLPLLPREYALLVHLAQRAGAIVSRAELTRAVLGLAFDPGTNVIAAHLSRLRAKLHHGAGGAMLLTEKGRGYRLVAAAAAG